MLPGQDIFTPINDPVEKEKVVQDMVSHGSAIKIKALEPQADVFQATPIEVKGNWVSCTVVGQSSLVIFEEEIIVQFRLSNEKYITQAKTRIKNNFLEISFAGPIFRVQQREDFRLRLPSSYQGRFTFEHNGERLACRLSDLSAGGCRIEIDVNMKLREGEIYKAVLSTLKRDDLKIEFILRHIAPHPESGELVLAGMQFVNQSEIVKNRMAALVMDLYRDFFTRKP